MFRLYSFSRISAGEARCEYLSSSARVRYRLHDVCHHESAHSPAEHFAWLLYLIVLAGAGPAQSVALAFTDGVVGEYRRPCAGVEDAAVHRVPGVFVATVSVHGNQRGNSGLRQRLGQVQDGGHSHAELRRVRDSLGGDAGSRVEAAVRDRIERG